MKLRFVKSSRQWYRKLAPEKTRLGHIFQYSMSHETQKYRALFFSTDISSLKVMMSVCVQIIGDLQKSLLFYGQQQFWLHIGCYTFLLNQFQTIPQFWFWDYLF